MSGLPEHLGALPEAQRAIWRRCRHPTGTFVPFPAEEVERSITERFARQVRRHPDRICVTSGGHGLTYEGLDRAADRVAHALLSRCGPREEPIGLLLGQDASLLVAMLGVLKAGKFYVPLDASLPEPALVSLLQASQAGLILTDQAHLAPASALARRGHPHLELDAVAARGPADSPAVSVAPDAIAVLLYTSGSTGRPKGVVQTHRNVLHMVMNHTQNLQICADDRLTLLFAPSFVGALSDIWGALLNGAAVCPFDLKREGPGRLGPWLSGNGITIYHSVTTTFRHFAEGLPADAAFPSLRLLHVGGEPVTSRDIDLYRRHFAPECVFVNMLGTTETGNFRVYFVDHATTVHEPLVPVGHGFQDKEVLLLDDALRPVGAGEVGEIVVRSPYLSPGYWREPELTRAAFPPDPRHAGMRLYRTGDLGRMRPDGCLEHHGRKDAQVKVRGYRVDVGAVETALRAHPDLADAVVVARESAAGECRLVAYVVPASPPGPTGGELRRFLGDRLADHMVPSAFVALEALPLTSTGKVDRRRLPDLARARPDLPGAFVAPRTPIEAALAGLWAEKLDLDRVGIHDAFLDLGGHSLLATQILAWVRDVWRVDVPLRVLFEAPTIADMARVVLEQWALQAGPDALEHLLAEVEGAAEDSGPEAT